MEMELPTHYPPRLQKALETSEKDNSRLDPMSRNHLIRVLSDFFYVKVQDPTPTEYATMAAAIVKRHPFLADSLPGVQCYVSCFSIIIVITLHTPYTHSDTCPDRESSHSAGFSQETAQPEISQSQKSIAPATSSK